LKHAHNGNFDYALQFIKENGTMPDGKPMPSLKLARLLYKDSPLRFKDVEGARTAVRTVRGQNGDRKRGYMSDKSQFIDEGSKNPYNLPVSDETVWEPYVLTGQRIFMLSDVHVPYHNIPALTAAITWAKKRNPDTILLNGDTIDFYMISRFGKDPKKRSFGGELQAFAELIAALRSEFPSARIIFKDGNHEERYNHFLYAKAGELLGVEEFSLENLLRRRAGDIEYVTNKRIIKAGDLNIIHGHEFSGGVFSPVNIARGLFLKAKVSAIQGHNHQTSEHTETDMNGRITTTWSVGCLSDLHPEYMPMNKWNHGFAFIEVQANGDFQVHNKRIHKGEVL
jgi:predicted phosphodiesterase